MTFAERMKDLAGKVGDAAQDFASKAGDRAQDLSGKGLHAGKEFLSNFGEKAQELGEKGKLTLEVKKLEFQAEKFMEQLGAVVYDALMEQKLSSVNATTPGIKEILDQLDPIQHQIDQKEEAIKNL